MPRPASRSSASAGHGSPRSRPTSAPLAVVERPGWVRTAAGTVVPLLIAAVALLALLQTFVLNPLAAAPGGRTLGQVYGDLEAAGQGGFPILLSVLIFAAGLGVAGILAFLAWRRYEVDPVMVLALGLAALVAATPAYWVGSFGMGMSLADTYGIGGGDHSPWAWPVYAVSAAALLALPVLITLVLRGR